MNPPDVVYIFPTLDGDYGVELSPPPECGEIAYIKHTIFMKLMRDSIELLESAADSLESENCEVSNIHVADRIRDFVEAQGQGK